MVYFRRSDLELAGRQRTASLGYANARDALNTRTASVFPGETFDVFLSHSFKDAPLILGIANHLEKQGLSVYIDWIVDRQLNRSEVTPETASLLRERMGQCTSLIYANSTSSPMSKWMPWELGYFDGSKGGPIAIMPIDDDVPGQQGQEYLGLYPAIERVPAGSGFMTAAVEPGGFHRMPVAEFGRGLGQLYGF
ncbi:uncharacterized protein PO1_contig-126-10 [Mycobacterium sp. PO1]|nr:uncharacterized protein PO1_contig-126-10 [Mycobacterium sp. PO1]GFM27086.1 uncharacterized protein PO2_contig-146-2 [Mycobacterium sp. PO2]